MTDNMEKASDLYYPSIKAEKLIKKIDCRLEAINKKELDKCKIKHTVSDGSEIEINQLKNIKKVQESTIAIYKKYDDISRPLYENLEWAIDSNLHFVYSIFMGTSFFMFFFGFVRWYRKVQLPIDNMNKVELEMKTLEIVKIKLEIDNLKKESSKKTTFSSKIKNL